MDFWQHNLEKGIHSKKELSSDQIIDISYTNFINDPLTTVKNIYSKFGFDMDISTENEIESYLLKQSKLQKEKHSYSLEEFGLSNEKIEYHFKNYIMSYEF